MKVPEVGQYVRIDRLTGRCIERENTTLGKSNMGEVHKESKKVKDYSIYLSKRRFSTILQETEKGEQSVLY